MDQSRPVQIRMNCQSIGTEVAAHRSRTTEDRSLASAMGRTASAVAIALLAAPLLWGAPALAQGLSRSSQQGAGATEGYQAATEKMNRDLAAEAPSGNPDRDFASMMAKHHQAAIDMARVELEHGRNTAMRRIAQRIVDDRQRELDELRRWLSRPPTR